MTTMKRKFKEIPIRWLRPDPERYDGLVDDGLDAFVGELVVSFGAVGQLQPIIVRRRPGDSDYWYVVAGMKRLQAAREAGTKTIWCFVLEGATSEQAWEVSIRENVDRRLSPAGRRHALAALAQFYAGREDPTADSKPRGRGRPVSKKSKGIHRAATVTGMSARTVRRALENPKLHPDVRKALHEKMIEPAQARKLIIPLPVEEQPAALADVLNPEYVPADARVAQFVGLVRSLDSVWKRRLLKFLDAMKDAPSDLLDKVDAKFLQMIVKVLIAVHQLAKVLPEHYRELLREREVLQ